MSLATSFLDQERNYKLVVSWYIRRYNIPKDLKILIQEYVLYLFYGSYCDRFPPFSSDKYVIFSEKYIDFACKFTNFNWITYIKTVENLPMNIIKLYLDKTWNEKNTDIRYYYIISLFYGNQPNIPIKYIQETFPNIYKNLDWKSIINDGNVPYETLMKFSDSICSFRFNTFNSFYMKATTYKFLSKYHPQFKKYNNYDNDFVDGACNELISENVDEQSKNSE